MNNREKYKTVRMTDRKLLYSTVGTPGTRARLPACAPPRR
jgi:hypothetical protein